MFELIQQNGATATYRRTTFTLIDAASRPNGKVITTTGVKVQYKKNGAGGALVSTNDITAVDTTNQPGEYYIEWTQSEVDTIGQLVGFLQPTGCDQCSIQAMVVGYDPYVDGANAADIATAVQTSALASPLPADLKKVNAHTVTGSGTSVDPWRPA